jgi:hypothetical protein
MIRLYGEIELEVISYKISIVIKSRVSELRWQLKLNNLEQLILKTKLLAIKYRSPLRSDGEQRFSARNTAGTTDLHLLVVLPASVLLDSVVASRFSRAAGPSSRKQR